MGLKLEKVAVKEGCGGDNGNLCHVYTTMSAPMQPNEFSCLNLTIFMVKLKDFTFLSVMLSDT